MFLFQSLFTGFITAGLLLVDFRNVTTENFSPKMEELLKHIKRITQQGTARKITMDINDKQSTTSVTQLDIPKVAWPSSSEASPLAPLSTIADLQQCLESSSTGALEGVAADTAAEVSSQYRSRTEKGRAMAVFFPTIFSTASLPDQFSLNTGSFCLF